MSRLLLVLRAVYALVVVAPLVYGGCLLVKVGFLLLGEGWYRVSVGRRGYVDEEVW